jgi:DNA-directed RNA polymerase sigma subunit (sigma70/sigma32)
MASSILERTNAQPLTLELLKAHVPAVKAGHEAILRLREKDYDGKLEMNQLLLLKNRGSRAQEALILSALPLIKNISSKEFQRRRAWNSRVSYDDILQEAIAGFIRGLLSYNEEAKHVSPTNYLGQWITTTIRRKIEVMDHDFAIPYEVIERGRRIKAVHSRLTSEKMREPSDEEMLEALNSNEQFNGGYKWGKVKIEGEPVSARQKFITQKQLDEARELTAKSYAMYSQDAAVDEDSEAYERRSTPLTVDEVESHDDINEKDLARSRLEFFNSVFISMRMGSKQKDIVLRYFGLSPYSEPQIQKEIVTETGLPLRFVKEVINIFSQYMPVKGGIFHQKVLEMPLDLIEELELSWLLPIVGDWPQGLKTAHKAPDLLTQLGTKVKS